MLKYSNFPKLVKLLYRPMKENIRMFFIKFATLLGYTLNHQAFYKHNNMFQLLSFIDTCVLYFNNIFLIYFVTCLYRFMCKGYRHFCAYQKYIRLQSFVTSIILSQKDRACTIFLLILIDKIYMEKMIIFVTIIY